MVVPIAALLVLVALLVRPATIARLRGRFWTKAAADKAFAVATVGAALVVLLRGDVWVALCLFTLSLWLLGRAAKADVPHAPVAGTRAGTVETVTDAATGRISIRIVAGPHRGAVLDRIGLDGCLTILAACRLADPPGARLLEDYLDRRWPLWRSAPDGHEDAGARRARVAGEMTEEQAYQLLGLARGAPREAVTRAHRMLMKRWHPDQGGSADLAARANEAKEVLLRRHG